MRSANGNRRRPEEGRLKESGPGRERVKKGRKKHESPDGSAGQLRKRAEAEMKSRFGEAEPEELSAEESWRLVHELRTHQIELEIQNEELRNAQLSLEEEKKKYADLYDFAPIGYFIFNSRGIIIDVNLTAANLLGLHRSFLINRPFLLFISGKYRDAFYLHQGKVFKTGEPQRCELELMRKDGTMFFAAVESVLSEGKTMLTAINDVTDRKRMEDMLQSERDRLQAVMDGAKNSHLVYLDREFNFIRVNEAYARTCGYRPEEMIGKNHFALYPDAENEAIFAHVRDTGEPFEVRDKPFEFPDQPERGVTYWDWTLTPVKDAAGRVEGLIFALHETTERMRAEEELKRSNSFNQSIIDSSSDCIKTLDLDGRLQYMSTTGQAVLGINDVGKYLNMPYEEFWKGSDRERVIEAIEKAKQGQSRSFQGFCPTVDGTPKWWDVNISPILGVDGKPERLLAVSRDITERKAAEEALRNSERRYRSFIEVTSQWAWLTDAVGIVVEDIPALRKFTGQTYEQARGTGWADALHPDDKQGTLEVWSRAVTTGTPYETEYRMRRYDGAYRLLLARGVPIVDDQGSVIEWVGTCIDITERKKAEQEIRQLSDDRAARNRELEELNKELETFNYSISHDLRAPLRVMGSFAKILEEDYAGRLDDTGRGYLARVSKGALKMTLLIDGLLQLSKISRQKAMRTNVDMSALAATVVSALRDEEPGRTVEVSIQERLSASADPALMELVLTNLLGNAWKFTSKTAKAKIEFGARQEDGQTVFFVRDNGPGFDPGHKAKLFMPFHRLHSEVEFEGTGIGLAIVERIIKAHGGMVWCEGDIGKGVVIYFTVG